MQLSFKNPGDRRGCYGKEDRRTRQESLEGDQVSQNIFLGFKFWFGSLFLCLLITWKPLIAPYFLEPSLVNACSMTTGSWTELHSGRSSLRWNIWLEASQIMIMSIIMTQYRAALMTIIFDEVSILCTGFLISSTLSTLSWDMWSLLSRIFEASGHFLHPFFRTRMFIMMVITMMTMKTFLQDEDIDHDDDRMKMMITLLSRTRSNGRSWTGLLTQRSTKRWFGRRYVASLRYESFQLLLSDIAPFNLISLIMALFVLRHYFVQIQQFDNGPSWSWSVRRLGTSTS